jgi:deoxyxylulose-5-phosphate synthase
MSYQQVENKVHQDAAKVNNDSSILVGDASVQMGRFEEDVDQITKKVKENFDTWVSDGAVNISEGYGKLKDDMTETAIAAAKTVKLKTAIALDRYNTKVQRIVDKIPGELSAKVSRYPWVAMSFALLAGLFLGGLLKPTRR